MGFVSNLIGSLTGANAQRAQARAAQEQAQQQQEMYRRQLAQTQNQLALQNQQNNQTANISTAGTANDLDDDSLDALTKANRKKLISGTLGI